MKKGIKNSKGYKVDLYECDHHSLIQIKLIHVCSCILLHTFMNTNNEKLN